MSPAIVPIVEGQAEVESVPILVRRVLARLDANHVGIARPFRVKRNKMVRPGELERAIELAVRDRRDAAAVIIILDSDDDCPAELGSALLQRSVNATTKPVGVVLAQREFEAWFLGAKESLRGKRGIRNDAVPPPEPEAVRGAKEELTRNMQGKRYLEVDDQPALAAEIDIDSAMQRCPSFDKLLREIRHLVEIIGPAAGG